MKWFKFSQTLFGDLLCPTCHSNEIKKWEEIGPWVTRYRCKKCGLYFRYDRTPSNPRYNPYQSFTRGLKIIH